MELRDYRINLITTTQIKTIQKTTQTMRNYSKIPLNVFKFLLK